jgi:hypothetical protein
MKHINFPHFPLSKLNFLIPTLDFVPPPASVSSQIMLMIIALKCKAF